MGLSLMRQPRRTVSGIVAALVLSVTTAAATPSCRKVAYRGADYTVCPFDPGIDKLALFNLDPQGRPFGSFAALEKDQTAKGRSLIFAMNAGMYDAAQRPVGLHVENGVQQTPLNRRTGPGNFHLKPNGVFYVVGDRAGVLETEAFATSGIKPGLASQSGPMLVIEGKVHPSFSSTGTSLKKRNGVGVGSDGKICFVISEQPVNFYDFAVLFRDELKSRNALFFDGTVSSLYDAASGREDFAYPLGPIVGVVK